MKASSSALRYLVIVQILIGSGGAWAQVVDPTEALSGTWDGKAEGAFRGQDERTIVITSVKPKDESAWVAEGRFGPTGGRLARTTIDVSRQNEEIVLQFVVLRGNGTFRLVLKGNNRLEGRIDRILRSHLGGTRIMSTPFKFEKKQVETRSQGYLDCVSRGKQRPVLKQSSCWQVPVVSRWAILQPMM